MSDCVEEARPLAPDSLLRVMSFEIVSPPAGPLHVARVARVDVIDEPSARTQLAVRSVDYDLVRRPYTGVRIQHAVRSPNPASAIVVATPQALHLVPEEFRSGTPSIILLVAARRLWTQPVHVLLERCHLGVPRSDTEGHPRNEAEYEAVLLARLLRSMLEAASADELAWLSRPL